MSLRRVVSQVVQCGPFLVSIYIFSHENVYFIKHVFVYLFVYCDMSSIKLNYIMIFWSFLASSTGRNGALRFMIPKHSFLPLPFSRSLCYGLTCVPPVRRESVEPRPAFAQRTVSGQPSAGQQERPRKNLPTLPWTSSIRKCEKVTSCCLRPRLWGFVMAA